MFDRNRNSCTTTTTPAYRKIAACYSFSKINKRRSSCFAICVPPCISKNLLLPPLEFSVIMFSIASDSRSLCCNFWKPWCRKFISGMQVCLRNISVTFVYQLIRSSKGHRSKKERLFAGACGLLSVERQSCFQMKAIPVRSSHLYYITWQMTQADHFNSKNEYCGENRSDCSAIRAGETHASRSNTFKNTVMLNNDLVQVIDTGVPTCIWSSWASLSVLHIAH